MKFISILFCLFFLLVLRNSYKIEQVFDKLQADQMNIDSEMPIYPNEIQINNRQSNSTFNFKEKESFNERLTKIKELINNNYNDESNKGNLLNLVQKIETNCESFDDCNIVRKKSRQNESSLRFEVESDPNDQIAINNDDENIGQNDENVTKSENNEAENSNVSSENTSEEINNSEEKIENSDDNEAKLEETKSEEKIENSDDNEVKLEETNSEEKNEENTQNSDVNNDKVVENSEIEEKNNSENDNNEKEKLEDNNSSNIDSNEITEPSNSNYNENTRYEIMKENISEDEYNDSPKITDSFEFKEMGKSHKKNKLTQKKLRKKN